MTFAGYVYILQRTCYGDFVQLHFIQAHDEVIDSMELNNNASILATVCHAEDQVKLWDHKQGM